MLENAPTQKELLMKYHNITIFKNKKCKTYYCRYRKDGKQNYISAKTQVKCLEILKERLEIPPRENKNKNTTFIQWYDKWFDLFKKDKVKFETIKDYNIQLKKIPMYLQAKEIKKITHIEIMELLNSIEKERARQKLYEFLKPIFEKAKAYKVIKDNIFEIIEKPKHEKQKGIALTNQQQEIFIRACNCSKYGKLYLFMLYQGLRIGEALALTYEDLKNNEICINKQLTKNGIVNYTKNKQSTRLIPLFDKTKQLLNLNSVGRIFNFTETTANRNLKLAIKNYNLPQNLTTHDLRHTFITNCKNKNIPEHVIQAIVGHEIGSKVTKQVYTHFNLEDNLFYINELND